MVSLGVGWEWVVICSRVARMGLGEVDVEE